MQVNPNERSLAHRCSAVAARRRLTPRAAKARWDRLAGLLVATALAGLPALAAPPSNDVCANATVIPTAGPFPYWTPAIDIANATTNGDPPIADCVMRPVTNLWRSAWYVFTPPASKALGTNDFYTISTCADAPTATTAPDTVLTIYTSRGGCNGPFVPIAETDLSRPCADDSCGPGFLQASITTQLQPDTTYFILVWQYSNTTPGPGNSLLQLLVRRTTPPPNDRCEGAIPLLLNIPTQGTTVNAGDDYELPAGTACFTGLRQRPTDAPGRDAVFSFMAPAAGAYSFKVRDYDTANELVLYVAGSCPSGEAPAVVTDCLAAANRPFASSSEEVVCVPLAAGQQVFIFVDEEYASPGSSFSIVATRCVTETEPNGDVASAGPLVSGLEGRFHSNSDVDFYALGSCFAPGSRVFAMLDGSAAFQTLFHLRVTTATDTLEFDGGDNDEQFGRQSPNVAGVPLPGGPAYLRLNSPNGFDEPYRLYAVVQPPFEAATSETEPNDLSAQANFAANNYFRGTLSGTPPSADADVFGFGASDGDTIYLSLDCDPLRNLTPINARLELLDYYGNILVSVDDPAKTSSTNQTPGSFSATTPFSPGEAIVYRVPYEGLYYARVSISAAASGTNAAGDYLLSISKNCFIGSSGVNTAPQPTDLSAPSSVEPGVPLTLVGSVADPDTGEAFSVQVAWGDGTSTVTNLRPGVCSFAATHVYALESLGGAMTSNCLVRVTVTDVNGGTGASSVTVTVSGQAAAPRFMSFTPSGSDFVLQLQGATPGAVYRIQGADNLPQWQTLGSRAADAQGRIEYRDTNAMARPRTFYRAVWP